MTKTDNIFYNINNRFYKTLWSYTKRNGLSGTKSYDKL